MPFSATVFQVLIASPSDVPAEREAIAQCLHAWNALHSNETGKVLLPVMWESHSAPSMDDRPQQIINDRVARDCDMLIGAFWMRLGSPTGKEVSGTVEEIRSFIKQKKPVMLYFSQAPVQPSMIDVKQFEALNTFKAELMPKGLVESYSSIAELTTKLTRQITITMRGITVSTTVDSRAVRKASEEAAKSHPERASTPSSNDGVYLEVYTEKSFITRGNTLDKRDELREAGGRWISRKSGGKSWCFSNKRAEEVAKILNVSATLREP